MSVDIDLQYPALFYNKEFFQNPYATYRKLLDQGDISFVNLYGGMWYISSYEGVAKVITDKRVSHSNLQFLAMQFSEEQQAAIADFFRLNEMWMIHAEGKQHQKYRAIVSKAFGLTMQSMGKQIKDCVNQLIDDMEEKEEVDFIQDFAYLLPAMVITKILGIPMKDLDLVIASSDLSSEVFGSTQANFELALQAQKKLLELDVYLKDLLQQRLEQPENDLLSYFLSVEDNGEKLTLDEISAQCAALLFGGHETTRNLLGNGLLALLQHPDQLQALKDNPDLIKTAVSEMLRYDSPVQFTVRAVVEDMDIYGQQVKAGSPVMLCFASANRDPSKFTDPDKFDIRRNESRNMSFGMGSHSCIGAQLAVMEAEVAFNTLFKRLPNITMVDETSHWLPNAGFRGLKELKVRY